MGFHFTYPFVTGGSLGVDVFFVLSGWLITAILVAEFEQCGTVDYKAFVLRRVRRLLPALAVLLIAMACLIPLFLPEMAHRLWLDLATAAFFVTNLRQTFWPAETPLSHTWSLAIEEQFYLIWPLVVFLSPRKLLGPVFLVFVALGPLSRMILARQFPEVHHAEAITTTAMDYFGIGALLALALERGMKAGDRRLTLAAWIAFAGYAVLYTFSEMNQPIAGFCYIQQTLVSVVFAGLISATLAGFGGIREKILEHPAVQHIGRLSFGLYLFHTPVPLFLGHVLPWLWLLTGPWQMLRLGVFGLTSWGLAWLCWRYLETRTVHPNKHAPLSSPGR